jgi:hypothetical protein
MEGKGRRGRRAPIVVQSFATTRLELELLAGVYERLVEMPAATPWGRQHRATEYFRSEHTEPLQAIGTGG